MTKGFAPIYIILGILIIGVGVGGYYLGQKNFTPTQIFPAPGSEVCTQDAKQCPDGSYVSRVGPNCEFAACPADNADETTGWKTYKEESSIGLNFSIMYPDNWYVNTKNVGTLRPSVVLSKEPVNDVLSRTSECLSIETGLWPKTGAVTDVIAEFDSINIVKPGEEQIRTTPLIKSSENTTVNGIVGIKREIINYDEQEESIEIFLKREDRTFIIRSCPRTDQTIFKSMVSTFKYTP